MASGSQLSVSESESQETLIQCGAYLVESGLSEGTVKNYLGDIRHFASWLAHTHAKSPLTVTEADIRTYCLELATEKAHPPTTVNRRLQSIRKFYRYALDSALLKEDPSLGIKLLPQLRSEGPRGLTRSEVGRLLDAVRREASGLAKRDYAIIQFLLQTGIRVGELARLRVADVALSQDKAVLKVRGQGKSHGREIPLSRSIQRATSAYLEERPSSRGDPLFLSRNGDPLSARSVQRLVKSYAREAGLGRVSTYTLRQTCRERLLRDTGDLSLVAMLMGHKRLETAIKYVLPKQKDLTEVAESSSLNL
jgi:integrase/recombinase XerC